MKKTKILTTIFGAGTLLASAPILATSCSNNDEKVNETENYVKFAGTKLTIDHALNQADLNAMQPTDYTFSDGTTHKAIFIDGTPYPIVNITELQIGNCNDEILTIPEKFLMGGPVTATSIEETCVSLQKLDLHGIKTTTFYDTPLTKTDHTVWCPNVVEINVPTLVNQDDTMSVDYFLYTDDPEIHGGLPALKKINLAGLKEARNIGSDFLEESKSLTDVINLNCLSNVKSIGHYFMQECPMLKTIDLSAFSNVTLIGENFLSGCTSLTSIDLSSLAKLEANIQSNFLKGCTSLESVKLPSQCDATGIDDDFLGNCTSLKSIDLSGFTKVTEIGGGFLSGCSSLTSVDMSKLTSLTYIGNTFLYNCTSITDVNMGTISPDDIGPLNNNKGFVMSLTQEEYNSYEGIKLTVDSTVEDDWNTAKGSGQRFAPIAWSGSGSADCRKWKA